VRRYDFHPDAGGWRVSEVNSEVPGGFTEAASFTSMVAEHSDKAARAGDPQGVYVESLARTARENDGPVVLLSAAGFMEDHQIVAGLGAHLRHRGLNAFLAQPRHLEWIGGCAYLRTGASKSRVGAIVRFYQGEWLARLGSASGWRNLFTGGKTPVANPGCAILSESKRLPLIWDELGVACPTWKQYLPETRDPRDVPWSRDDSWLLKTAYCNTGDSVTIRSETPAKTWNWRRFDVLLNPRDWIAQRRFETTPIDTPRGPKFPCVGVYTIDGRACGVYGRLSTGQVVNYSAVDVAVLIERDGLEMTR